MPPEIRPVTESELDAFVVTLEVAAGRHAGAVAMQEARGRYETGRTLAAFDGDRMVGGTASQVVDLTAPGGAALPAAKITLTGLLPSHRGQGLASAFMRRQLADLRARGEPLAVLTTSHSGVPGRHGFSPATRAMAVEVRPGPRPAAGPAARHRLRLLDRDEAARTLPGLYDRHRREQAGQVSRPPVFWRDWFLDLPLQRIGPSERFFVLAEDAKGGAEGYLTYRLAYGPLREQPVRELLVEDLITVTEAARGALWAYCLGFDQAELVSAWNLPVDEPLAWTVPGVRTVRVTGLRDFLRLRLLDVAAALGARRYSVPDALVLEVADDVLEGNAGRYLLRGGADGADCAATREPADLALSVAELSAAYLGGVDLTTLARAGRVTERTAGALRRANAMFAWWPGPWTVTDW